MLRGSHGSGKVVERGWKRDTRGRRKVSRVDRTYVRRDPTRSGEKRNSESRYLVAGFTRSAGMEWGLQAGEYYI